VSEARILNDIMRAVGALPHVRIFRNSVGHARDPVSGQHMKFGLAVGASDLVGIVKPRGRFIALEVKSAAGRLRPEQDAFLRMVVAMGGVAGVVRSVDEALALVEQAR